MSSFVLVFLGLLFPSISEAQDAVTLSAQRAAQVGFGHPTVTIHAHVDGHLSVSLTCAGRTFARKESISPGQDIRLDLKGLPQGQHQCGGTVQLTAADGSSGSMPLNVGVAMFPPLELKVPATDLDLEGRMLRVKASRPLSHLKVDVIGPSGQSIGSGETTVDNVDLAEIQWSQSDEEAVKLMVTGQDIHTLPGQLELSPWSYAIPHEDIVFETGQANVRPGEAPKLEHAWGELEQVVQKYGRVVTVNLYIAGYTDTVGNAASNRSLSLSRARSIANWFKTRGFKGEIHFQGFGESALAVPTPDETDEPANRRAVYILAAQQPARSDALPSDQWKRLQ